jgi:hypothetical protein
MPKDSHSADEIVSLLTFPRHTYPNLYLNKERIHDRFTGYAGAISDFRRTMARATGGDATVDAVFVKAGFKGEASSSVDVAWDMGDPLAQSLVLRAYVAANDELADDVRAAQVNQFVLAQGPGNLLPPSASLENVLPATAASEIEAEGQKQRERATEAGDDPTYWPAYSTTANGLAVSLLGIDSLKRRDVRSWLDVDMTLCIFGQKIKDQPDWVLLQPLHVWLEPK